MPDRLDPGIASPQITWPEGRRFAFTIFDDPDLQSDEDGRTVYDFLASLGFKTTRGMWPLGPTTVPAGVHGHCEQPSHTHWLKTLQRRGFELGLHNARLETSSRSMTIAAIQRYRELFGENPVTLANHMDNADAIYWGSSRLGGWRRLAYDIATRGRNRRCFHGHEEGSDVFWGDICKREIIYVRNFVYRELNTLRACPCMPYHDPARPWVNQWFASSEGGECASFVETIREEEQDRLEEQEGAAIMYTHFGKGFVRNGALEPLFKERMTRLARKNGWFVPVRKVLDIIRQQRGEHVISAAERSRLEWKWLRLKLRHGTS